MADLLIRNLKPEVIDHLKKRAERSGRSLQGETRAILEQAAGRSLEEALANAGQWRRKLGRRSTDSASAQRQDRRR